MNVTTQCCLRTKTNQNGLKYVLGLPSLLLALSLYISFSICHMLFVKPFRLHIHLPSQGCDSYLMPLNQPHTHNHPTYVFQCLHCDSVCKVGCGEVQYDGVYVQSLPILSISLYCRDGRLVHVHGGPSVIAVSTESPVVLPVEGYPNNGQGYSVPLVCLHVVRLVFATGLVLQAL